MVAADFGINPAAARMRWSRLRKNIAVNSAFKDDPNVSLVYGQKKPKRKFDGTGGAGGSSKKNKPINLNIKGEDDEDDDEVMMMGEDEAWDVKREAKSEAANFGQFAPGISIGGYGGQ